MTVDQLNRTKLDPPSFRLYAALLCESDMSVNRIAHKTGMTRRTISKKMPLLLDKDLAVKTNNRSKVPTYSGIDPTEPIDSTVELNDAPKDEPNSTTGESFSSDVKQNDTDQDAFRGELGGIWEKYS
jgi:biotin operon repressor|tara:strand:+ start:921 stop:1301 length:381 start_codon:yes stop_codon:yes gene_type:complete